MVMSTRQRSFPFAGGGDTQLLLLRGLVTTRSSSCTVLWPETFLVWLTVFWLDPSFSIHYYVTTAAGKVVVNWIQFSCVANSEQRLFHYSSISRDGNFPTRIVS